MWKAARLFAKAQDQYPVFYAVILRFSKRIIGLILVNTYLKFDDLTQLEAEE